MMKQDADDPDQSDDEQIVLVESRLPSEKELFYLDWIKDVIKNQFNLANELLKQIITLCVALLSVSVIFENLFEGNTQLKFFTVLFFFISLILAGIGVYPVETSGMWLNSPGEIEKFKKKALHHKKLFYALSSVFLLGGIAVIIFAVLRQVYHR